MAAASRPAWGCIPCVREEVDTFGSSALVPVRPTTALPRTPRCLRRFGRLLPLRRGWLCSIRRRRPEHPFGAPYRTERRSENWAIPSLCRATPSATSEHCWGLLGSSPIPRSFVASCVSLQLRPLPSPGITRVHRSYGPLRHPRRSGLPLTSCQLIPTITVVGFPCCVWSPLPACRRQYPGRTNETRSLVPFHRHPPSLDRRRVGSCVTRFGACTAFTIVTA